MVTGVKELAQKYRILIYSGVTDAIVPTAGTKKWLSAGGFKVTSPTRAWPSGYGQGAYSVGNTATDYGNLTFATVAGAGHFALLQKPKEVAWLVMKFIFEPSNIF